MKGIKKLTLTEIVNIIPASEATLQRERNLERYRLKPIGKIGTLHL